MVREAAAHPEGGGGGGGRGQRRTISRGARRGNAPYPPPPTPAGREKGARGRHELSGPRADSGREAVKGGAPISEQRRDERSRSARSAPAAPIGLSALRMRRTKSAARSSSSAGPTCAQPTSSVRTDDGSERGEVGLEHGGGAGPVRMAGARPRRERTPGRWTGAGSKSNLTA